MNSGPLARSTGDDILRVRTDFFVAVLRRRAEAEGAYVSVARRGAEEAGAVFLSVDHKNGRLDLFGPAPQSFFDTGQPADRRFIAILEGVGEAAVTARMEQEIRFDPDLWLLDIEDRQGRSFLDIVANIT